MGRWVGVAVVVLVLVGAARAAERVPIYVGPQLRDGFTDVDAGTADSIKDIQTYLKKSPRFVIVPTADRAIITLIVVGRRTPGSAGSVGVPVGNLAMFLPVNRRAIDTILRVGTYERLITSEADDNDQWRASAKQVVRDVTAWLDANAAALTAK